MHRYVFVETTVYLYAHDHFLTVQLEIGRDYMVPKGIGAKLFHVSKTGVSSWTNTDS